MVLIWAGFIVLILLLLALDLGVFHRKAHVVEVKEALKWSAIWIALALLFAVFVYFGYEHHWMGLGSHVDPVDGQLNDGIHATIKYLTGYIVEKSLSVDNIFVIAMIFAYLSVPAIYQHRVLFWGILGALIMRGAMIAMGAALIARFTWILYIFGVFLIATAIKMFLMRHSADADPGKNPIVRLTRRFFPVTDTFHGQHFFVRAGSKASHEAPIPAYAKQAGAGVVVEDHAVQQIENAPGPNLVMLTPLAIALVMIETTDLIFAVDSIPAIFAITADPFLVFTSNVFAILGLRSLYFALAGMINKFRYLKPALAIVLGVVGVKMLTHTWLKQMLGAHFNLYLLGLVLGILGAGVVASLLADRRGSATAQRPAQAPAPAVRPVPAQRPTSPKMQ